MAISAICALIQACAGSASFRGCHGDDRIFLAGDAAHVVLPNGGFGGNTEVHDAHNLAWKLAYVLKGVAGPGLLATYAAERRPVGEFTVEQSYSRYVTRVPPYLGTDGIQPVLDDLYLELGCRYASAAVLAEPGDDAVPVHPRKGAGRRGTRAPHAWVERDGQAGRYRRRLPGRRRVHR